MCFLRFATKEPNGLLIYNGRFNEKHDFIAMEIINEQIQLTFSAGTTVTGFFLSVIFCKCFSPIADLIALQSFHLMIWLFLRWDQDNSFPNYPGRRERWPVARGGGSLLQQGQNGNEWTPKLWCTVAMFSLVQIILPDSKCWRFSVIDHTYNKHMSENNSY